MLHDRPSPPATPEPSDRACAVIETERLTLRRPTLADVPAIAALANDIRIAQMTRRLPFPYRDDHARDFIAAIATNRETVHLIEHLHVPVGMVGIDGRDTASPELGYWIGCDHWGRGFATEAARAAIDRAFEMNDVAEVRAVARVVNPASRNVLEKCGFKWTGVELHRVDVLGSSSPVDCFRLSRENWLSWTNWTAAPMREG